MTWWRGLDRGARIGLAIVAVGGLLAVIGGVSAAAGKSKPRAKQAHSPLSCLLLQGLTGISDRGAGTWRGIHQGPPYFAVLIDRLQTPTAARQAVQQATLVHAAQAGPYAVTGPATGVADAGTVKGVASCLTGSQ